MNHNKIFLSILFSFLNFILSFIYIFLIRIYIDIQIIGYFTVITSFFLTFGFITRLGFGIAHLKYFHEAKDGDEEAMYNGTIFFFKTIQFLFYISLMFILVLFIPIFQGDKNVIFFICLACIFKIGRILFIPLLYAKEQIFKRFLPITICHLLEIILFIMFINFMKGGIFFLAIILFISNLIAFSLHIFFIRNFKYKKPPSIFKKKYLIYAIPFSITLSLNLILQNIDILMLYMWVSFEDIANYETAKVFYSMFVFLETVIISVLLGTFSKNIINGDNEINLKLISQLHKFLNLFITPVLFLVALYFTPMIVFFLGKRYELSGTILTFLCINTLLISGYIGASIQLRALGQIKLMTILAILRFIIQIFLMILFIAPFFLNMGVIGATISIVLTNFIMEIITRPYFYIKFKIGFYWGAFRNLLIMLGIFLFQLYINQIISYPLFFIPLFILLDIGLYFLINYIFKGFSREDFKFIKNLININTIKSTILEELKPY